MSKKNKNISSDLQGISKLSIDAVKGTTKVVESLHSTISQYTSVLGDPQEKTKGVASVVYKSINVVTHLLGEGINAILNKTSQMHGEYSGNHKLSSRREAIASAMNGVLGDHFDDSENPLAINMSFRNNGKTLSHKELIEIVENASRDVTILIHGLCMNDLQWTRDGHNHGLLLAEELGHTILNLHYNTGLHISENGKQLSQLLSEIMPTNKIVKLNMLTHSMGGLVARSACYYANQTINQEAHTWLSNLNKLIFLGTPHHGALLAKGAHWADVLLQISPYSAPFAKITKVRSNGLTDLRHGYIIDEQWQEPESYKTIPLPENIQCYAIATTASEKDDSTLANDVVGDGLVTINSALGIDKNRDLNIPKDNQWVGRNISHIQLLSDKSVYLKINKFISANY